MDLFAQARQAQIESEAPLAHRMRPRALEDFAGQDHIVGKGRLLRRAIEADQLSSLIFFGPPGTGKTTLAAIIANHTRSHFVAINAVLAGVKQIREVVDEALERRNLYNQRTTLFVDEVHRWNKAQQDALLPHVENGTLILIGATTENPYFEVNKALVSRSRIFQLTPLQPEDLRQLALRAIKDEAHGYGRLAVEIEPEALDHLVDVANGDARGVLNALELAVETTPPDEKGIIAIDLAVAEESIQRRAVLYDKDGDAHYDTISAFIKSLRGSDPDAALYWMAKMIYAGEDPRFIFRRMAILAGEDVGLADPNAMSVVSHCWQLYERIGLPEGRFHLAQAALYLATCPKSNSTMAFFDALATVEKEQEADVPNHLKDGNRDSEGFGHGQGYLYPHAYRDHWIAQQYLPVMLQGKTFYEPSDQGYEARIQETVMRRREAQLAAMVEAQGEEHLEVLSTSPVDRASDSWLQRTVNRSSDNLAQVRERLFELAALQRHHVVLVVNEQTGMLTWEAVRQTLEGGVLVVARDAQAAEALQQLAERLPQLNRPQVTVELEESTGPFDVILGRNLFTQAGWERSRLAELPVRLGPDGRLYLAQIMPRRGQRLYALVDWSDLPAGLFERVRQAEEGIYQDETDPLVNWDMSDLEQQLEAAGFVVTTADLLAQREQRQISAGHLARWFGEGDGERRSYGERLSAAGLNQDEIAQVSSLYGRQLRDTTVSWESATAILGAVPQRA